VVVGLDLPLGRKEISVGTLFPNGTKVKDAYSGKTTIIAKGKATIDTDFDLLTFGKNVTTDAQNWPPRRKRTCPRNTLASFQKAMELGVDMIELDVFTSKDNIAMVIHDPTVDRTTKASGLVANYDAASLQELGVPTLSNVFDLVQDRCEINIEIKEFEAVATILNLINTSKFPKDKLLLSKFRIGTRY